MSALYTPSDLRTAISRLPRVRLAHLPTPLHYCPRLSRELGVELYIKRDDLTGLALGGNKTRNLEFRMAEARAAEADILLFAVEVSSNSARQTTAAANMLGMDIILLLRGDPRTPVQGNLLLNHILGADVRIRDVPSTQVLEEEILTLAEELRAQGRRPFSLNHAPMFAVASAVAYVEATLEVLDQMAQQSAGVPTHLYMTSGSKGQAGLILAKKALGLMVRVVGIAASPPKGDRQVATARIAQDAARVLGLEVRVDPTDVENSPDYVGPGYGIPTPDCVAAIREVARKEGILLDPVYTGKGMAGLLDHIRRGVVPSGSTVVFIHTGGQPALFAHAEALVERG